MEVTYINAERLASSGRLREAQAMCAELLQNDPDDYLVNYLIGAIYLLQRNYEKCRERCKRLLEIRQDNADTFNMMAAVSADGDLDFSATESWLEKALACDPNHTKALVNLGNIALQKWDFSTACEYYNRVLELTNHTDATAYSGLAGVESVRGNLDQAISYYELAMKFSPNDRRIVSNLLGALYAGKRKEEAVELALKIAKFEFHELEALGAFSCLRAHGLWADAEPLLPIVLDELCNRVNNFRMYMISNLSLLGVYEASGEQLLNTHKKSGESIEKLRIKPPFEDHPKAFSGGERIRLAYVSADLKAHVVTHFFRELVNCRNRGRFEIFLYSCMPEQEEDEVTEGYIKLSDHFIRVFHMPDVELAERIRNDGIQILVDMGGYTTDNRLVALSYRPAPVQISYLGYPYTYGLKEIDYTISDPWLDGPLNAESFVEQPLRLPQSFITIGELFEQEINYKTPFERNGYITFGSLNNVYKLNPQTIALMSRVLLQVPNSRIYLNHPNYNMVPTRNSVMKTFVENGIEESRITIIWEKHPSGSHLRYYNEIDIVLDAMPLTGGTTTIDALWMGVPVITKVGDAHPQRLSYSIINNVGINLDDCIAFNEDDYVKCAVTLANNPERMAMLHRVIPESMKKGILCDPIRFTAQFESALIDAWNQKFPEIPIESLLGEDTTCIKISNASIVVREVASDQHTYVLKEQGCWYESEALFLEKYAHLLGEFWDFSEDPGVFAVPFSHAQAGTAFHTVAIRQAGLSSILLKQTIDLCSGENLRLVSDASALETLPDVVRFSLDCNDGTANFIKQYASYFQDSTLILASLRSPAGEDKSAFNYLMEQGFQPYRLLPGYDLLIPLTGSELIEPSWINLFFCQTQQAEKLAKMGLLANVLENIIDIPIAADSLWVQPLKSKVYAAERLDHWISHSPYSQWSDMYHLLLNLDTQARDQKLVPAQRHARLQMAFSIISLLIQSEVTVPRLLTGIRIAADMGLRMKAVEWATVLVNELEGVSDALLNEPFLMPFESWEGFTIPQDESDWTRTAALVVIERLRSFSSWYTADESMLFWQSLMQHPSFGEDAKRIVALIEARIYSASGMKIELAGL